MQYPNEYLLDLHDLGYWMARWHERTYPIGRDKAKAKEVIANLNEAHRPNLELRGEALYVCWNTHEKSDGCDFEVLVENAV